jgi:hypothetical protein
VIGLFARKTSPLKLFGFAVLAIIGLCIAWVLLASILGGLMQIGS